MLTNVAKLPKNFRSVTLNTGVTVGLIPTSSAVEQIEVANTSIYEVPFQKAYEFRKTKHKFGTVSHYLHCQNEYVRLNRLRTAVNGKTKDVIDYELADITLILSRYDKE